MYKKHLFSLCAGLAFAGSSFAGDIYFIGQPCSLVTANRGDLETFMALNQRHMKSAVRSLYNRLATEGLLFNLPVGARVEVASSYSHGTAEIIWGDGAYRGFINKSDLTFYLGNLG